MVAAGIGLANRAAETLRKRSVKGKNEEYSEATKSPPKKQTPEGNVDFYFLFFNKKRE